MGECDANVVTVEEMEVDSGPVEVNYPLQNVLCDTNIKGCCT